MKEDAELHSAMSSAERAFQQLNLQLTELSSDMSGKKKAKVEQIMGTSQEFVQQYQNSINQLRQIKKKLFDLTE